MVWPSWERSLRVPFRIAPPPRSIPCRRRNGGRIPWLRLLVDHLCRLLDPRPTGSTGRPRLSCHTHVAEEAAAEAVSFGFRPRAVVCFCALLFSTPFTRCFPAFFLLGFAFVVARVTSTAGTRKITHFFPTFFFLGFAYKYARCFAHHDKTHRIPSHLITSHQITSNRVTSPHPSGRDTTTKTKQVYDDWQDAWEDTVSQEVCEDAGLLRSCFGDCVDGMVGGSCHWNPELSCPLSGCDEDRVRGVGSEQREQRPVLLSVFACGACCSVLVLVLVLVLVFVGVSFMSLVRLVVVVVEVSCCCCCCCCFLCLRSRMTPTQPTKRNEHPRPRPLLLSDAVPPPCGIHACSSRAYKMHFFFSRFTLFSVRAATTTPATTSHASKTRSTSSRRRLELHPTLNWPFSTCEKLLLGDRGSGEREREREFVCT